MVSGYNINPKSENVKLVNNNIHRFGDNDEMQR